MMPTTSDGPSRQRTLPLEVRMADRDWHLLPQGGVYWPDQQMLLVADLHLGKDATFRSASIGVPRGSTQGTLQSLSDMLACCDARELVILGDLFHARSSLSKETIHDFESWLGRHAKLEMTLVRGNHDRHVGHLPSRWGLSIIEESLNIDRVLLTHVPTACSEGNDLVIAGHLHPADVVTVGGESTGKLPCFWLNQGCLTLPACGQFTGTAKIRRQPNDQVWLIADDRVVPRPR